MRTLRFVVAIAAYLLFFATFLYLVGWTGNLVVPRTVDAGGPEGALGTAIFTNIGLLAVFGLQHSVMARPGFKKALTRTVPPAFERTVYVLASVAVLWLMFIFWMPMPEVVWSVGEEGPAAMVLWAAFATGWLIVFISTWLLNHFELFGLQQAWHDMRGTPVPDPRFREPLFYKVSRHPLYLGFLIAFWAIPTMTQGHLLFAAGMTVYVLVAIRYEERDLADALGDAYREYRTRVGMLLPGIGKAKG
ncbi:isoprenylcysteine carboxylmethyltransferase family protein [Aurantiacibacter sp. MUD11]|uniref:methanethiol S-methyltransferase n=1 Tax=Aurantiacibacter sp. MUD11 TaxID=3003265 RepID=UPI0022AA28FD|nr:methanethiol S-methyltransferase [Aurantiacibacter sp. MUD11]WAT18716.1 isoprenylcysteine carboxylmethyltransferase family protein [Aurantiacibacter sp. MUD11]